MKLVDANVLLYAVNESARHHLAATGWLNRALSGQGTVLLPWVCVLAFLRLSTHSAVFEHPLDVDQALDVVDVWLAQPNVIVPEASADHAKRMREMLQATGVGGNLVTDAHIAALAVQARATVVTFDNDFGRFPGVRWEMPK